MPFSFMMGVDWEDSFMVARLIGYKTFFNEFVAYEHLSKLINLRKEAGPKFVNGVQQYMSVSKYFYFSVYFFIMYMHSSNSYRCLCASGQARGIHQRTKQTELMVNIASHNFQLH